MIRLHQFAPALGLPNVSPFCMKLEAWLRLAGLPYETVNRGDVLRAPKRKLPFVEDDGRVIADSTFIIDDLTRRYGIALDAGLTPAERAQALAFQRLFEENLYWAMVHTRWADPRGWVLTRAAFFGGLPPPVRWLLPPLARRGLLAELRGHGMGRHAPDEILAIGARDIAAVADFLGDRPFLLGPAPTSVDATAFAFLANLLWVPLDSALRRAAADRPTLEAYARRMAARCFPEWGGPPLSAPAAGA